VRRNHGCPWYAFVKDAKKKVKKYSIPIVTIARKPTIHIEQVKEWKELRKG